MNDRERAVQQVSIWIYDTNTTDDEVRHINDTEGSPSIYRQAVAPTTGDVLRG